MLCAELWDFDAIFRGVDGFLLDAFDFIAENEGIFFLRVSLKIFQGGRVFCLFNGVDVLAFSL